MAESKSGRTLSNINGCSEFQSKIDIKHINRLEANSERRRWESCKRKGRPGATLERPFVRLPVRSPAPVPSRMPAA
jgi:hypothetical protein